MHRITALILAGLAGCAMTPGQVAQTEPLVRLHVARDMARLAPCLRRGIEEFSATGHVSQVQEPGTEEVVIRLHGHADLGTLAVARLRRSGGGTDLTAHVTTSVWPRQSLADEIGRIAQACAVP